jgi:hypothetical protein
MKEKTEENVTENGRRRKGENKILGKEEIKYVRKLEK